MTELVIKSGDSGLTARIDTKNRLKSFSTSQPEETTAALAGDTFVVSSTDITLTTANESGLLHIENTDTVPWILTRLFFNGAASTGGTGEWRVRITKNSSTGTLITAGTVTIPQNLNFGAAQTLDGTFLKGAEGLTLTDGITVINTIVPTAPFRLLISNNPLIVMPGSKASVAITPPSGNTSFLLQAGFVLIRFVE